MHHSRTILSSVILILLLALGMGAYASVEGDLRKAAKAGDLASVERLLYGGVDPDSRGKNGGTALIKAAKAGHVKVVQLLLFYQADPAIRNKKGRTAAEIAERNEHLEIASILKEAIHEQSVVHHAPALTPAAFATLMEGVFKGRGWQVEKKDASRLVASYERKGRLFKVNASYTGNRIQLRFLRGYGARKTTYLENLKKDLEQKR